MPALLSKPEGEKRFARAAKGKMLYTRQEVYGQDTFTARSAILNARYILQREATTRDSGASLEWCYNIT